MISVISIAIIIALSVSLDLCLAPKKGAAFSRYLIYIIVTLIPTILQSITQAPSSNARSFYESWFTYFYPTFILSIILTFSIIYFFIYLSIKRNFWRNEIFSTLTFFDLLFNGYNLFKERIEKDFEKDRLNKKELDDSIRHLQARYGRAIAEYILDLIIPLEASEANSYITYALYSFVGEFFNENEARFTVRQLNYDKKVMETIFTTREDKPPGDIPLNKPSMIKLSQTKEMPIIYSRNPQRHFKTKNNSISKGVYDDYVSFCVYETDKQVPFYSLCLDVKGEAAAKKMANLVDSGIFSIVCLAIAEKLN